MIKLGKFPTFFWVQISNFFYFAYFLKPTPTLAYFMLKMIRSEIFCKNSHWKGVKTPDLWSVQYFSHPNHCNFQSKIVKKVLILKLYNLAHFILALWPLRLPRAFLEKWCVSIKSVCYFNSALLWWFEVCTVEINYQSQSRQSHGSCYRLRNWSVMNIHLPTAISCSSEYSDSSNYPKCQINSNFYMNCWLCLTIRKTPLSDITDQFPNLSTFWFDSLVNFTKCKK